MTVIIGVDPHKASHTAVAIGDDESELASIKVRSTRRQVPQLLAWAEPFGAHTWAIESAGGLGYLLAQQLVGAPSGGHKSSYKASLPYGMKAYTLSAWQYLPLPGRSCGDGAPGRPASCVY